MAIALAPILLYNFTYQNLKSYLGKQQVVSSGTIAQLVRVPR